MIRIAVCSVLLLISLAAFGQREVSPESWKIKDRGFIGFGLAGLNLGTDSQLGNFFTIGVSAQAGYMLFNSLSAGVGMEYNYITFSKANLEDHQIAGYPFLRFNIQDFFIQADYGKYTLKEFLGSPYERKITTERFFIGAGYSPATGSRGRTNIFLGYDILYLNSGPFASPITFRVYFTFP